MNGIETTVLEKKVEIAGGKPLFIEERESSGSLMKQPFINGIEFCPPSRNDIDVQKQFLTSLITPL
jgi:hypothetical protein